MADLDYEGITSDISECSVGDTVHISMIGCSSAHCPYSFGTGEDFRIYEDGIIIDTILGRTFMDNGYDYVPSASGEHIITMSQIGYDTSNPLTITVTGGDSSVTWTIGNKEVESLTINNKEVKSILRTSDNAIIYEKSGGGKIDTQIVNAKGFYLEDINGNRLSGKTVYYEVFGTPYTSVTTNTGLITEVGWASNFVFDGDDTYNGCTYP